MSKILKKKIVVRLNTAPSGWDHNVIKSKIYKFFINRADGIIVNSNIFKNQVKKKYNVKSTCILNPFDFKKIKTLSFNKVGKVFSKKSLKIITVGRMTKQKDQITLLKAVNLIKNIINFNLVIIGKGSEFASLKKYIEIKKLKNRVKLLGYKKNPFPYIKQADVFILPSRYEGSPNVLVEAMYLGKSIISADCPTGPREILDNGKYGDLFKVGNFTQLSKILIKFKKKNEVKNYRILKSFMKEINCKKYFDYVNKFI
mgnify:CR=1 FL=1